MIDHELNVHHAMNPKVGDYWQESMSPVCVVVDVKDDHVTVCDSTVSNGDNTWSWNLDALTSYTRKQFCNRYRYGRVGNKSFEADDTDNIKNKFWCDVMPEKMKEVRDEIINQ